MAESRTRPFTGQEYIESLRDGREIYIYGERVKDVTTHPAFRNTVRMLARLYDALHDERKSTLCTDTDTGSGGYTHKFFRASRNAEELVGARDAIAEWARVTYGWMGRSPDYKAAFLATLGANSGFYAPYEENAKRWYKKVQEECTFVNHAIVNPPVDRNKQLEEVRDVYMHVEKETDGGLIVSGAKVVATTSTLTHYNFIANNGALPIKTKDFAFVCIVPTDAPGVKLFCRPSYELAAAATGSPFDYPLSSRLDENDSIIVFDKVFVPYENVFAYGDIDKVNNFFPRSGFLPRFMFHGCVRLAVKLDFIAGPAAEGRGRHRNQGIPRRAGAGGRGPGLAQSVLGADRRNGARHGPVDAGPRAAESRLRTGVPRGGQHALSQAQGDRRKRFGQRADLSAVALQRFQESGNPQVSRPVRARLKRVRAEDRVKLMKLMWDAMGTEFGGRHELYERNYFGSHESIRFEVLMVAEALGQAAKYKGFAEQCMSEYNLDGWTVPDLINPDDVSIVLKKAAALERLEGSPIAGG